MPRIFDNIERQLLPALRETIEVSDRADFCVGYFNLRGWKQLGSYIERWEGGEGRCCRLLVGMQKPPQEELRAAMSLVSHTGGIDNQTAVRLKKKLAEEFRDQLTWGVPTNEDEAGLRRLAAQIKARKVVVKLFLKHPLHAKLYLLFRPDPINPTVGYLGSSNLTFAGLAQQGELNIDVLDHDACNKLAQWFEDRWSENWCLDISNELVQIIEESWAREELIPPYHIYVKMAYHLSQEARAGLAEFRIPRDFGNKLFEFQKAAVKIAAHHLNKRGGVLIGDVVGLGKTLMATAVARIFEDDHLLETLIICPKNLVPMWEDYREQYRMHARVLSISRATRELPDLRRYRLVLIDESHNLRNREGKTYRAIQEYIQANESKCILLSATPYNKTYLDLSNQLRLFVLPDKDLGVRPERILREIGETEFIRRHQCSVRSLAAFEKSEYADDWRELMRLYMVRRTRSFIKDNYAATDETNGRGYLTFEDGSRSYFPNRLPRTVKFQINDSDPQDQYARLYKASVVDSIDALNLPRYGLGNYEAKQPHEPPTQAEAGVLRDLSRAGKRLMGFCRTNIFKRLESSGQAFLQSIERHILRNYVFLHAIENGEALPIGTQDSALLDARTYDEDSDEPGALTRLFDEDEENGTESTSAPTAALQTEDDFQRKAAEVYASYATEHRNRFKWLRAGLFNDKLAKDLRKDAHSLLDVLSTAGDWDAAKDAKLDTLFKLIVRKHPTEKVMVFTQFADTVRYLASQLKSRGVPILAGVTGDSPNPTALAWRFSPVSNNKRDQVKPEDELRVLIATDVLSEGQNLQDCAIVVNYDLPWAIIRLVQRAGRVDRIGQLAENILCYSFLPAEGVDRIIKLRARVRQRLTENAEVVGADEAFFEDDRNNQVIVDLYNEKAGILDGDADTEVDLASYAYQIWKNAITDDPGLENTVEALPAVVYSTKAIDVAHAASLRSSDNSELAEVTHAASLRSSDNSELAEVTHAASLRSSDNSEMAEVAHAASLRSSDNSEMAEVAQAASLRESSSRANGAHGDASQAGSLRYPDGVLVYLRTAEGNDALAWADREGNSVTESQFAVLKAAECSPDTPALPRREKHHQLVQRAVELIVEEEKSVGGQLGRPSAARFRTYERLKRYAEEIKGTLFESPALAKAIDEIYRYPLRQSAIDTLNRQLRSGISDQDLAELVIALRDDDRLCIISEEEQTSEPRIICSMGLRNTGAV